MRLTFAFAPLRDLLKTAETQWPNGTRERWGEEDGPGFWLVGDQGVYLMSNAVFPEGEKPVVLYADECNPDTMPFDEWWAVKNATFGGDDGVEFIDADTVRSAVADGSPILVDFTPTHMSVKTIAPAKKSTVQAKD